MDIYELNGSNRREWDEFVWQCQAACHFHLAAWFVVLESAFGHKPHYLFAMEDGQVKGILPLIPVSSRLSGRYITSLPGGICSEEEKAAEMLIQAAVDVVKRQEADYLILRDSYRKWDLPNLVTNADHITNRVALDQEPDKIWSAVNRRTRQSVNKAYRADLRVIFGQENLDSFYPTYSRALQERGTPTQGRLFFESLFKELPSIFNLLVVCREDEILGGGIVALFKDTIYNTWSGMPREHYDLRTSYILYWETLKFGCERGFQWVDLGRSEKGSGVFRFKNQWRGDVIPLYQQYYLNGISQPPAVGNQRSEQWQYRIFIEVWKHLPSALTEIFGTQLRKRIPFG